MSEPLWCEVRQQYCRCHDYGKRCEDWADESVGERATTSPWRLPGDIAIVAEG